ncbi:hypothetical protein ACFP1I_22335 [Dyadobacter subterraneus]|uniref:Uncharacterized protein n=1 Tax=Dyadobacter subterraneus TaxID=2773304 RepID=A0ABR9WJ26_9BACT|nr:hypothetical protein [Dyadobacter subterraneus]MBE9465495.1 hypothetical protein [Dyadobacter subterraneus]
MERFTQVIRENLNVSNLHQGYTFSADSAVKRADFLKDDVKKSIYAQPSIFEANVHLKRILKSHIPNEKPHSAYFWMIRKWGGIGAFRENDENIILIDDLLNTLAENRAFDSRLFGKISSLSKVASFVDSERYAIYDARAIYTLNWLIAKMKNKHLDFSMHFFPMSAYVSRNKMINARPFNLIYKKVVNSKFYNKNEAFYKYCELLQAINPILFPEYPKEIFRTEMLLFSSIEVAYNDLGNQ